MGAGADGIGGGFTSADAGAGRLRRRPPAGGAGVATGGEGTPAGGPAGATRIGRAGLETV